MVLIENLEFFIESQLNLFLLFDKKKRKTTNKCINNITQVRSVLFIDLFSFGSKIKCVEIIVSFLGCTISSSPFFLEEVGGAARYIKNELRTISCGIKEAGSILVVLNDENYIVQSTVPDKNTLDISALEILHGWHLLGNEWQGRGLGN